MNAFSVLSEWPVGRVSAGVLRPDGTLEFSGDPRASFDLASVTKPLTALAIMVAVEEGIVSLDEPIGPPGVTMRHLLSHASGLAPDQRRLLTEPNQRRIYSNSGIELAADAVATAADMDFATYLAEAVAEPLGMTATALTGSPAHGASSCVADLMAVAADLLRADPLLLDRATVDEMTSPAFGDLPGILPGYGLQEPNEWGLGVEIRGRKRPHWTGSTNSPRTFGHFGRAGTFIWIDPDARTACVVLTDREFGEWAQTRWPLLSDAVLAEV